MFAKTSIIEWASAELSVIDSMGLQRRPPIIESTTGPVATIGGREFVCLCSNDYLGLASNAAPVFTSGETNGSGSSRLVAGNFKSIVEVERSAAELCGYAASLLFPSGYMANIGAIPALTDERDIIFSDSLNHASLIDGCRLSRAKVLVYPHRDTRFIESELKKRRNTHRNIWFVSDALFSMEGTLAPVRDLRSLADQYGAFLYIDEAHSLGVLGPEGRGLCASQNIQAEVMMLGLGKAFGAQGGFILAKEPVVRLLYNRARSFIYTTAPSPSLSSIIHQAILRVQQANIERARLRSNVLYLRKALGSLGFEVGGDELSPIMYLKLGGPEEATAASRALMEHGVFISAIRPPTVPEGTSRLRIVPTALHSLDQLRFAIQGFEKVRHAFCFT